MDSLKPHMESNDILQRFLLQAVIGLEELFDFSRDILGQCCFHASNLVGYVLVRANCKPRFTAVAGSSFQSTVQLLDKPLGEGAFGLVNDHINAPEVVGGLDDIINIYTFIHNAKGVRLEDKTGLVMGQPAAFYVVGVVGQLNLHLVVDATGLLTALFFSQNIQQGGRRCFFLVGASGLFGIRWDTPGLAHQKGSSHTTFCAVVPDAPLRDSPFFSYLGDR